MAAPPALVYSTFTLEKSGNRPHENEDATFADPTTGRFAISDGATESWESRPWAISLVQAYVRQPPRRNAFATWHASVRRDWTPPPVSDSAMWYALLKRDEGAFATLLGLELVPTSSSRGWELRAIAVGDSCLFVIRKNQVHTAFPFANTSGFGSQPKLVPSASARCPEPEWLTAPAEPSDLLLLATDAVAAAFLDLRSPESRRAVLDAIEELLNTGSPRLLLKWFHGIQKTRNDDLTLLALRLPAHPMITESLA
jgi:hypothetical protein